MGAMMAGGVAAGIYITNGPEACHVRTSCTCNTQHTYWTHDQTCTHRTVPLTPSRRFPPPPPLRSLTQYITAHSEAEVVVVDDVAQLKKYAMATQDQLPRLKVTTDSLYSSGIDAERRGIGAVHGAW